MPIETAHRGVVAWAKRGKRYYEHEMSVEEFNKLAPDLFTTQHGAGHEPIPQVIVVGCDDEAKGPSDDRLALLAAAQQAPCPPPSEPPVSQLPESEPPQAEESNGIAARITAALADKNHRVPELAALVGITSDELSAFIESPNSGFYRTAQGWVKPDNAPPSND